MSKLTDWFEIFRAGKHTDSKGNKRDWTENDLDKIAGSYDPASHEAPAVIGHPESNAPAYGWVEGVKREGAKLFAKLKQVEPQFARMVEAGRFKKRSISVGPDMGLRHIGFLGAKAPAVKGLKDFKHDNETSEIYEFNEKGGDDMSKDLEKKLEDEKAAREAAEKKLKEFEADKKKREAEFAAAEEKRKRKEINEFVEGGIKDGKILPAWKTAGIEEFMAGLDGDGAEIEFSEGKKETRLGWFKEFVSSFAEHPLFAKMTDPDPDGVKDDAEFEEDEKTAKEIAGVESE